MAAPADNNCLSVSVIDSVKDRTPLLGFVVQLAVDLLRELTTNRQLERCTVGVCLTSLLISTIFN